MSAKGIALSILILALSGASALHSQPWRGWKGSGGWGMHGPYQRMYDPSKVETITGVVEAVDLVTPMSGMMHRGVHLRVKTERETVSVHLGPDWYIEKLDFRIEKGDRIEVRGARVTFNGQATIIAAEVLKGKDRLILRDAAGTPAWAGGCCR